ncbi:DUF4286 family protein [Thermomonas sp.]|uniref:DUF4286 family protein n=1 Tax=Thermomonas sp. TaxID=1971895 RepID=UPI002CABA7EB|nr:DUF4286 family protein [Thermomonas sp.]HRO62461.1 DUF4286 family protein [Thermomonas sp.]
MEHADLEHPAAERADGERAAPVIYEVNLDVDAALAAEYRVWLRAHVAQMLALPGFVSARIFEVVDPPTPGRLCLCVHYRLRDAAALQDYFDHHAARMRADGTARFGSRFTASRRVLRAS